MRITKKSKNRIKIRIVYKNSIHNSIFSMSSVLFLVPKMKINGEKNWDASTLIL